jgi:hypothetical protein
MTAAFRDQASQCRKAASHLRHAVTALSDVPDTSDLRAQLERLLSVTQGTASRLDEQAQAAVTPVGRAKFDATAAQALPTWGKLGDDVRLRTYALYLVLGLPLSEYLGLKPEQRAEHAKARKADLDAQVARLTAKPGPKADDKPEPQPAAAQNTKAEQAKAEAKPKAKGEGLAAYRQLKAECKAAGLDTKGTAEQLRQRLAEHKPAPTVKLAAAPQPYAAGTILVADGKGSVRPAMEAELWAALERLTGKAAA